MYVVNYVVRNVLKITCFVLKLFINLNYNNVALFLLDVVCKKYFTFHYLGFAILDLTKKLKSLIKKIILSIFSVTNTTAAFSKHKIFEALNSTRDFNKKTKNLIFIRIIKNSFKLFNLF